MIIRALAAYYIKLLLVVGNGLKKAPPKRGNKHQAILILLASLVLVGCWQ
jgi:hypothetical protein